MLTFIDKNEVYSERKFDEVSKKKKRALFIKRNSVSFVFVNLLLYPVEDFYK